MTAPLTGSWSGLTANATDLDLTTYGQGSSFPATWNTARLFWRTDRKRMYMNKGTEGSPSWEGSDIPIGTVNMYCGAVADIPAGYLLCNGQAVSRTTYSELFARLSTEYGVGDGSTTFNVPDFVTSNKFPRGATDDTGRGTTGGEASHTLTEAEIPSHTHVQNAHGHTLTNLSSASRVRGSADDSSSGFAAGTQNGTLISLANATATNQNTGGGGSHENRPPFLDVHFIIAV